MFRMCWRTWGAETIERFTVFLQQPWEVLFWLWGYVLTSKFKPLFFVWKVWTSRPVVEEKSPINLTFGLALQQIVDLVSFVNTIETSHHTNYLSLSYVILGRKEPNIDNQRLAESRKSQLETILWYISMKTKQTSQEWEDVNLAWNATEYDGVTNIRYNDGLVKYTIKIWIQILAT